MRSLFLLAVIASFLLIAGCKKGDRFFTGHTDCDYVQASSAAVDNESEKVLPLFTKYYGADGKLDKIYVSFMSDAGGNYEQTTLKFAYDERRIRIDNENTGNTVAVLNFNPAGFLTSARIEIGVFPDGRVDPDNEQQNQYRYFYQGGRLKEIQLGEFHENPSPGFDWYSYMKVEYDYTGKNVAKLSGIGPTMTYTYDYSRKAKNQFYADERFGDYFFYFLKYLDLLPGLNPENILVKSFKDTNEYPGKKERTYSQHAIDRSGKLLFYKQETKVISVDGGSEYFEIPEEWNIDWKCANAHTSLN
jgi:hypothetical protein